MRAQLLAGLRALLVLTILCGVAYPLVVTGLAQGLFDRQADGSLIERDGQVVGSELLGQTFTSPGYFHGRPSAAGDAASGSFVAGADGQQVPADPDDLSLTVSGASNLGPSNEDLIASVQDRVDAYRAENGLAATTPVPVDAVTASASGVDPHISVANAKLQAQRVATARGIDPEEVLRLIDEHTDGRSLGFLGEAGVNVLQLNLALDELAPNG